MSLMIQSSDGVMLDWRACGSLTTCLCHQPV